MGSMFDWLGYLFGYIIQFAHYLFKNYGMAIIFFTVVAAIIRFPLTIYQQKQTASQARLQPKMNQIRETYKNNREAQGQAMQELYQKEGVSQMAGCLPMIIQFPLLYGLLAAIYKPFTCVMHLSKDLVTRLASVLNVTNMARDEMGLVNAIRNIATSETGSVLINRIGNLVSLQAAPAQTGLQAQGSFIAQQAAMSVLDGYKTVTLQDLTVILGDRTSSVLDLTRTFTFFGIDLLQRPAFWNSAVIISFLTLLFSAGGMILSNKISKTAAPQTPGCSPNIMAIGMGALSFFISLSVPAALALYWGANSAFGPLQSWVIKKYFGPDQINAGAEARRLARMKLNEQDIYDQITKEKGKLTLVPDPLPEIAEKAGSNKKKKK